MSLKSSLILAVRLDWGFGNPNKTAALIVSLMLLVWVLPTLRRGFFWPALLVCTALGGCLMQTASRGGIVAAALGLGLLLVRLPRPWPKARLLGGMAAFWLVLGLAVWLPTARRFGKAMGGQDLSILSRLGLWQAAPSMMADAPGGWGLGQSADVFHQWYQPVGQTQLFTSLINSHLTWMAELGWLPSLLYVFGWLVVLLLCWIIGAEVRKFPALAVPFSLWVAFGVTAWFNSVAESPWLWLPPAAGLGGILWWRWRQRAWPGTRRWLGVAAGSVAILSLLLLSGIGPARQSRPKMRGSSVVLGGAGQPAVWLLVNRQTLGGSYGQTLRRYLLEENVRPGGDRKTSLGLVSSLNDLSGPMVRGKILAVCGTLDDGQLARLKTLLPACDKLVLLNPSFFPQALGDDFSKSAARMEVVAGEFSQVPTSSWTEALKSPPLIVPGAGDYLARWPALLLNPNVPANP